AFLFRACIKDRRAIAESDVIPLPIFRGRIVNLKKELEQPAVADLCRIENNLDGLGVSSVVAVGSIRHVPTRIANPGRDHAVEAADKVLHAPEAATCENGAFFFHRGSST